MGGGGIERTNMAGKCGGEHAEDIAVISDPDPVKTLRIRVNEIGTNLAGECGWEHAGEEFERDREQELHEGNDDEDGEGNQTKQVRHCPYKLSMAYKIM